MIAGLVPEAVVDHLEVVEVDEHDGRGGRGPAVERVLDALAEEAAVGQSRQRIVECLEHELLFEGLAFLQIARV